MSIRKQIILAIFALVLFTLGRENYTYIEMTMYFDILCLLFFLGFLSKKDRFIFPSALFVFVFYLYAIFGKLIWLYREFYWFNEPGNPDEIANYFSMIGISLIICSCFSIQRSIKKKSYYDYQIRINISKESILIFTAFTFVGAFLFTNQFNNVALFSDNMDATRVLTNKQSEGGRGIGFILLTFGIIANSLILIYLKKERIRYNPSLLLFFLINTLLLSLYSGRFLPVIPIVIYLIATSQGKSPKFTGMLRKLTFAIIGFLMLMFFGARRAFGSNVDSELVFRYLIGDSFPEFRMTVYANYLTSANYFDNFFYTIISGVIPGPFFTLIGLNKYDYFRPIGGEILKITHFDPIAIPGIRTSLFGELYFTGMFIPLFLVIILILLGYLDRLFFRESSFNFRKYRILAGSIFLCFSIPYGSLFLVSCSHFFLVLYLSESTFFKKNSI